MTAVILTGARAVESFIVDFAKTLAAFRIRPYPILKALFDKLLFGLSNGYGILSNL